MSVLSTLEITPTRLRVWGIRSLLSVLDQGLTSGASFLLNLFLARWLTGEDYGVFAIAFVTLLFVSGYHNVLLLEPMTVLGPARYSSEMTAYLFAQLKVNAVVVVCLSGMMLLTAGAMSVFGGQHALITATVASALALPFLLLFWLVRRMCYVVKRPAIAAWASAGYFVLVLAGLFAMHEMSHVDTSRAFLLVAVASVLAVLVPLRQLGLLRTGGLVACPWGKVVAENWQYGRWLVASTTLLSISSQAQTYLAAAMLGLSAAGTLRAMQIPALAMTQIITATGVLMLPPMSSEFGIGRPDKLREKAMVSTLGLTAMATAYAVLLALFAKPLERILFDGKFASYAWLIPVLGLVPVCTGFTLGFSIAQRASQRPHYELLANAVAAPVALVTALVFTKLWGITGAAISLVAGYATIGLVLCYSFVRLAKGG
jgi:O-antigen/teichoic acid export membrane protein